VATSLALAKCIDRLANGASEISNFKDLDDSIKKKLELVRELVARLSHEEDEDTDELQEAFRRRVGSNASASVSLASGFFGLLKAEHTVATQSTRSVELPPHLKELRASERSKNLLGNSNRLDSSRALEREDPVFMEDSPFVLAVNWAISLGGDTRTNACVAGALAGAHWGIETIPEVWQMYCEGVEESLALAEEIARRNDRFRNPVVNSSL
jgi:hypothetical protein